MGDRVTVATIVFAAAASTFAGLDWWAVARRSRRLEYWAKPAATAALLGVAATLPTAPEPTRYWFVAALAWCLAGDVFLMLPPERWDPFIPGLASFLIAHLAFTVGFATRDIGAAGLAIGGAIVALVAVPLARRFVGALRTGGRSQLVGPVLAYLVAIAAMTTTAVGARNPSGIAGAALFMASDALIGETRFVAEHRGASVAIMVTYHLALAGLVASLL